MATQTKPWWVYLLLVLVWPAKVVTVYFWDCARDVAGALVKEWRDRRRYTGWER